VSLFLKIEAEDAIGRIDELLAPDGVDGAMIGPVDLSINMGIPGQTTHPRLLELVNRVREACLNRGVRFGDYVGSPDAVTAAVEAGASWVIVGTEMDALGEAWRGAAASVRD
jgi:2-keto-3-deoxy-L-rhamnonate aldolase RhmA